MFVGGNLVSWKGKKQPVVARFTAKTEYRAMTLSVAEMIWLRSILVQLKMNQGARLLELRHVATREQVADCLTKRLNSLDLIIFM
jgi:hypothetical protein